MGIVIMNGKSFAHLDFGRCIQRAQWNDVNKWYFFRF